jgi:predicted transcriptional regulator
VDDEEVMSTAGRQRARGALEQEVLACLAVADGPLTPAQVRDELGHDTAYTTVMTTLARLHDKRVLAREAVGRAYAYSLVVKPQDTQKAMTAYQMHRLLDAQADREAVLAKFVAELGPADEKLLTKLLERDTGTREIGKRGRKRKPPP